MVGPGIEEIPILGTKKCSKLKHPTLIATRVLGSRVFSVELEAFATIPSEPLEKEL